MLSALDIFIFGFGAVVLALWLFLYFKGRRYADLFESLSEKEFPLKEIYFVGYAALEMIGYSYHSKNDRKLRKEIGVLYGEKYADYYLRVIHSQQITFALTLLALAAPLYGLGNSTALFFIMVVFAAAAYYYFGTATEKKILKRSEEMLSDFSNVVSKLALLTNAGMITREAWTEVAYTGDSAIYTEMQTAVDEMNNGVSEVDALYNFGTRCVIPEIKKFTSTIVQGLTKGNSELAMMLQQQSKEVWEIKKQQVRRQGQKAASKLMIPIVIMFLGILIIIIVPVFANIGI